MLDKPRKLTTQEVADEYRRHPVTIRIALQDGALHGRQSKAGGRWLIDDDCAEAWSKGEKCRHAQSASEPLALRRAG